MDGFRTSWGVDVDGKLQTKIGRKEIECILKNRAVAVALIGKDSQPEEPVQDEPPKYHENFAANEYDYSNCRLTITASQAPAGMASTIEVQNVPLEGDGFDITGLFDGDGAVLFSRRPLRDGVDFGLAKKWIGYCREKHGEKCQPAKPKLRENGGGCWATFRVVDVQRSCVVDAEIGRDYIALSYVWGQTRPMLQLLLENKDALYTPGALTEDGVFGPQIPRTILDAMESVRRLGERYIWIDALCICQNDFSEKAQVIQEMDLIYSCSMLTIVAAAGDGANAGLAGLRQGSRNITNIEKSITLYNTPGSAEASLHPTKLTLARSRPSDIIDGSTWNSRGWTYQERLFSERLLIFTPEQVYFWCSEASWCEDTVLETDSPYVYFEDRPLFKYRLRNDPTVPFMKQVEESTRIPPFAEYARSIEEFSKRNLSFVGDILDATAGLRRAMGEAYPESKDAIRYKEMKWHYGLPSPWFEIALSWLPEKVERRKVIGEDGSVSTPFPSWSWTGWTGPLRYQYPEYMGSSTVREVEIYHFSPTLGKLINIHSPTTDPDGAPFPPPAFYDKDTSLPESVKSPHAFNRQLWHPKPAPTDPRPTFPSLLSSIPPSLLPKLLFFYSSVATVRVKLKNNGLEVRNNATNQTREYHVIQPAFLEGSGFAYIDAEYMEKNPTRRKIEGSVNQYGGMITGYDEWNVEMVMVGRRGDLDAEMGDLRVLVVDSRKEDDLVVRERMGFGSVSAELWGTAEKRWELVILG